jgi:nucleoside-diphosphate-sugar epimerase
MANTLDAIASHEVPEPKVRRAFVTGATGFLGQRVACELLDRGVEVHASRHCMAPAEGLGLIWHDLDLASASAVRRVLAAVRPDALVHLAWNVGPDYQSSPNNDAWAKWSAILAREFVRSGGRRILMAGSCAEYDWAEMPLGEASPCRPGNRYGAAKLSLFQEVRELADDRVTVVWPRLFFLFGEGERPGRVIPRIIRDVESGQDIDWISSDLRRDYLHADEAASAIAHLSMTGADGVVNVASGEAPTVTEIAQTVARALGKGEPSVSGAQGPTSGPVEIRADASRLARLGWTPTRTVAEALASLSLATAGNH